MAAVQHEQGMATMSALAAIPPFPPIAAKLLQLVGDDEVHLNRVVELLRSDTGFSSEVLRLANSPLHALLRQIDSLQQALVVIGLDGLKRLVVTVASRAYASSIRSTPELLRCWRHMLACGLLSEEIARACSLEPDQAYTAGLMHDTGRLGLLVAFPEAYAALLRDADRDGAGEDTSFLLDRERETFGIDHCRAGQALAEKWGLPEAFAQIAGRHHDRHYGAEFGLLDVVSLGCRLADSLGFDVIHTNCPWSLEEARGQLPERARPRFWADAGALRAAILERLEKLDPLSAQPEGLGRRTIALAASDAPRGGAEKAPILDTAGEPLPTDVQAPPIVDVPEITAAELAVSTVQRSPDGSGSEERASESSTRAVGEINWAPIALVATALVAFLLLLLLDPLGGVDAPP